MFGVHGRLLRLRAAIAASLARIVRAANPCTPQSPTPARSQPAAEPTKAKFTSTAISNGRVASRGPQDGSLTLADAARTPHIGHGGPTRGKILEGSFIAETFRAHSTNFFRQEKSFQDLLWPAHRYSGTGHTRITLVTLAPDSPARDLLRQPGEARRHVGRAMLCCSANGTQLTVATCKNTANQHWTL